MQVASLSETLTVTGEAPLVDVSSSQVTGNVDRRQMEELPLQGRNWMELAMQVKGITTNAISPGPIAADVENDAASMHHRQETMAKVPLGRMGTPAEIASVVGLLVADGGAYINGQMIQVNGGGET